MSRAKKTLVDTGNIGCHTETNMIQQTGIICDLDNGRVGNYRYAS